MLILVGVTVTVSLNGGLFKKAREGTYDYKVETVKENLANYEIDYYLETGHEIKDEVKEAIAIISIETGIDADKFIVWHDEIAIEKNEKGSNYPEIYIFYDWNKASLDNIEYLEGFSDEENQEVLTDEEKNKLDLKIKDHISENTYKNLYLAYNRCFIYDFNGDGYFNQKDISDMQSFITDWSKYLVPEDKRNYYKTLLYFRDTSSICMVGDIDLNMFINSMEIGTLTNILLTGTGDPFQNLVKKEGIRYTYYNR